MNFISRLKLLCAIAALVSSVATNAGELPTEPILRIDPDEHTAKINRIASDEAGRYLVTASDDKTARVWNLADGRLLKTLRLPIGAGNVGKLYSVALSPDGNTVALGGVGLEGSGSIFLFDRTSGHMLRRIVGVSGMHLAFSPDGRTLAELDRSGLILFSVSDGRQLANDRDYGGESYSVQFSTDGRLVTTSFDGYLRLYRFADKKLTRLAKRAAPGGQMPLAARFSPDGLHIAVGFYRITAVNILNARDLSFEFAPNTAGVNSPLFNIAWSNQGDYLYAAGMASKQFDGHWQHLLRRWSNNGSGQAQDFPVGGSYITDIAPLPDGRLAHGGAFGDWGVIDEQGRHAFTHVPVIADFVNNRHGFMKLSVDGVQVRFEYDPFGLSPAVFDSQRHAFVTEQNLTAPLLTAPDLNVTDWENSTAPKLNGTPIKLQQNEMSRSLALLPGGGGFALGTSLYLRLFDRNGNQLWNLPTLSEVRAVNVSQDGRWVVAADSDGIIRWHRASDGVEQLAFFPHVDKKRWVLWTPSGYYDASPGAEDLIGWHLNRGKDHAADFFPASRFRERFNRPDVLAKILSTQDETVAVRLANEESGRRSQLLTAVAQVLPPVVEIVSPVSDTTVQSGKISIRYTVRTAADAPVTAMRVRVNGLLQTDSRNLQVKAVGDTREITVNLPEQDAEIQLFAENKFSVSTPAILRLKWAGKAIAHQDNQAKSTLYVLAVGVSKYKNPDYNLGLAAKDATDFASTMQNQKGKLYGDVVVHLLTDEKATKDDVLEGLDWLKQKVTSHDVGIMFVAGHGMNDKLGSYYFLPHNVNPEQLIRTGVSQDDIKRTFANLPGKTIFFVDTCFSGSVLGTVRTSGFINELASAENGAVVFAASTAGQESQEDSSWGNGAFTKSVVEGMNGKADFRKNGLITAKGLDYYVDDRVKELTKGQQSPVSIAPGGITDFPIAVVGK